MVPQTAEPPRVAIPHGARPGVQAMARKEGAPLDWMPNIVVEQCAHHNANKALQRGRQIHPKVWDKDGNLQTLSPWMIPFILVDRGNNRTGTEVQITHAVPNTHLQYTIPTSNALVTYGAAHRSQSRLQPNAKGTAYTVCTSAH